MERLTHLAMRFERPAYAALRIVAGLMFAMHGGQKLFGWFTSDAPVPVGSIFWWAGVIELVTGFLIAIGLFTRPAAFLASGEMAVAYFMVHWKLDMSADRWSPLVNHGELVALYSLLFLSIMAHGAGAFSVDALIRRTPPERAVPAPRGAPTFARGEAGE